MPRFPHHIHHFTLDDQFLLFDERSSEIRVLNSTASFVCERWLAGAGAKEIAEELSELTGAPGATTLRDTSDLLAEWSAPTSSLATAQQIIPRKRKTAEEPRYYSQTPPVTPPQRAGSIRRAYRLLDFHFIVESDEQVANEIDALLGHLSIENAPPSGDACLVCVEQNTPDQGWRVTVGGSEAGRCTESREIVPLIHANTLIMAYKHTDCLSVLHAAAVGRGDQGILLPAASGSGKSTLTAALVAGGLDYYTDDLALLAGSPLQLMPAPTRIGIKQGSWSVLESRIPELSALPTHRRSDGRLIKYYLPPGVPRPAHTAPTVAIIALVFPQYIEGAPVTLSPIGRAEAFSRFTQAGYDLPDSIDPHWVAEMIAWISKLDCYALTFGDLSGAAETVRQLVS